MRMGRPSKQPGPSNSQEARLGAAIRRRREDLGITQEQLATAIGFSRPHLALVELGRAYASEDLVRRCDAVLEADGAILAIYPEVIAARERRREGTRTGRVGVPSPARSVLNPARAVESALASPSSGPEPAAEAAVDPSTVAAFFGSQQRLVITIPLRALGTGRLVLAREDVDATQRLARFVRAAGLDTQIRYVEPTGELDFSPAGLVVICGPKSSPVIAETIAICSPIHAASDSFCRPWVPRGSPWRRPAPSRGYRCIS